MTFKERKNRFLILMGMGIWLGLIISLSGHVLARSALGGDTMITAVYPTFDTANIQAFQLNGNAVLSGDRLQLTQPSTTLFGTAWWKSRVSLLDNRSFSTYFTYEITEPGGGGADGLVFAIQTQSSGAGSAGGGLGYGNISPSVGIEFDTWHNTENPGCNEPDGNHIGLDIDGDTCHTVMTANPPNSASLDNGIWHVWVDYDGLADALEVRMSTNITRPVTATLSHTVDFETLFEPEVYVGFTASTGGSWERHEILSFYFHNDYIPGGITPDTTTYVTAPAQVTMLTVPGSLTTHITPTGTISATVQALDGTLLSNQTITFTTNLGIVDPVTAVTNNDGVAAITLSATAPGSATVRGTAVGGAYGEVEVEITAGSKVYLPLIIRN